MDFSKLLYFTTIAETLNYSRAAEKLYVSQSNLSEQIKKIEEEVGQTLVKRDRKKISLTKEGEKFLSFCKKTLEEYDNVLRDINKMEKNIKVGIIYNSKIIEWFEKMEGFNSLQTKIHFEYSLIHDLFFNKNLQEKYDIWFGIKNDDVAYFKYKQVKIEETAIYCRKCDIETINPIFANIYYHAIGKTASKDVEFVLRKNGFKGEIIAKDSYDEIYLDLENGNALAYLYDNSFHMDNLHKIQHIDQRLEMGWFYNEKTPEIEWILNNLI